MLKTTRVALLLVAVPVVLALLGALLVLGVSGTLLLATALASPAH